ncbi:MULTISPECIES: Spx/MgsR family RNA polymerase-binding regulatory protein [unclassified Sporolactobacillus]|uniref:Spx/MgsR family RNA polymerase-binding regulatory protein n=1 Tax=unclassified Sporolactobacillus TaxID=2628533 RepID=UPI002368A373|nr:Spx/MgsR family RNA polymerase-binding regulatory protein [Sporolactobacillus sp. CQH2019]MDD9149222.1 Spx/MgsR family RNA polymerase-binding regulatory protein [Sporolactobacillus sp. CQH2019]
MKKLIFYTYPSCTSCRKTKGWLRDHAVSYEERHLFRNRPNVAELMELIKLSKSGVEDILATRSTTYKQLDFDLDNLPLSRALRLLSEEPRLLKRPILTDGERLVVGYHRDDLMQMVFQKADDQAPVKS